MHVELEQRDHLLVMGVRRPQKMNALSRDMYRDLSSTTRSCGSA